MITKDGKDLPILEITPENYKVPAGEEGIYHVKMEVRLFDRSDGHRISHPFIQKFERIDFENGMMSMLRQQGYHMEILHNPQEWLKEHPQGEGRVKKDSGEALLYDTDIMAVDYVDMCGFRMEHGHNDTGKRPVIIGHEHPSVRIAGSVSGGIKLQCFLHLKKEGIIVIPPFSPLSSGSDLSLAGPETFMSPACKGADVGEADVYAISESGILPIGKLSDIENIEL